MVRAGKEGEERYVKSGSTSVETRRESLVVRSWVGVVGW